MQRRQIVRSSAGFGSKTANVLDPFSGHLRFRNGGPVLKLEREIMRNALFGCLALVLAGFVGESVAQGPGLPSSITLQATGIVDNTGGANHNGTYTLTAVPGYSGFYRYQNAPANPSVCWGVSIAAGNKVNATSGPGQFKGIWTATGDIWTVGAMTGHIGTSVSITANP
jgi:hypothetical protein